MQKNSGYIRGKVMKILHISRTMGQGGAEKVVYQICKDSNDIEMVIASTGGIYEDELNKIGVKHFKIPDIDCKNPISIIKTFFILRKIIKNEKIDIVHSHHRMAAFYSRILNICNRKFKRVYTAHNIFYNKKILLRFSLKGSTIVACGDGVKNNLVNFYNIKEDKISIIYNSVEVNEIGIKNGTLEDLKNKNKIIIGTIGRLTEQKGIDIFIKSISKVVKSNKNVVGVIVGDGENRNVLENLVKDLNIEKNIIFLGYQKNVFDIIKQLDFIILASRWEGFPLTPIEVFSMKKTIIASNIDGNNEIVKHEYNGLLFEKDNIDELSNKIEELVMDEAKITKLEKEALKTFNDKFSYDKFINNYLNLYKNTLNI